MKFFRTALILIIVVVLAGFFYWFFEVKRKKEKKEVEEKEALLFEESERKVVKLTLKEKDEEPIVLERITKESPDKEEKEEEEYEWVIHSPVETGGDKFQIDSIVSRILKGSRDSVVWENLEKEHEYGLDDPALSLRFYYEGDETARGIDFGIESLDRKKVFVKIPGQERILAVPADLRNSLNKSLFDLRDKRIAVYDSDDITGVSIFTGVQVIVLEKEEDTWYILPDRVKASSTRVDMYTGNIRWGNFVEVMEEEGKNFELYGLDKPRLLVTFKLKDDSTFMFIVGDMITEGDAQFFYATRSSDSMIFQVKSDTVSGLVTTEFELRDRKIFDFKEDIISAATLEKDGKAFSFVKKEDEWYLSGEGQVEDRKLERGYKVENIARAIVTAEYEVKEPIKRGDPGYAETGIENPRYRVDFKFKDDRDPLTVVLTEKDEETGKLYLSPDNGETAYYTSGYFISNFPDTEEELLE